MTRTSLRFKSACTGCRKVIIVQHAADNGVACDQCAGLDDGVIRRRCERFLRTRACVLVLAAAATLGACAADRPSVVKTFALASPEGPTTDDPHADDYAIAASAWCDVGICQVGGWNDHDARAVADQVIYVDRPRDLVSTDGLSAFATRGDDYVAVDASLDGFALCVAIAHEIGHVVLNTPTHVVGGVMGGADCALNQADRELACASIGACP